jgi:hypothetical protein
MIGDDPRQRDDGLGWVTRAVFPDARINLQIGAGAHNDAGASVVAYAVVPSVERARFLIPLASRRVRAATLSAYNALRPPKVRAARAALSVLVRLGIADLVRFPVLRVMVAPGVDTGQVILSEYLSGKLGGGRLHAAIGVRPPDPNAKPTLQLFDDLGRPRGYAKIGWNEATRGLVRAEAAALRDLSAAGLGPGHPLTPRLASAGDWGGGGGGQGGADWADADWASHAIAVIEPLPPRVRGLSADGPVRLADLLAVARRGGPASAPRPLGGAPYSIRLAHRAGEVPGEEGERIRSAVNALLVRHGGTGLEFGHWHGDWVPWNLGTDRGRLVAWDWEHSAPDVPVGFDLAHHAFQVALILQRRGTAAAVNAAADALARHASALGLSEQGRLAVADAYLIEMWLRTAKLASGGAGWNTALHPALLDALDHRLPRHQSSTSQRLLGHQSKVMPSRSTNAAL